MVNGGIGIVAEFSRAVQWVFELEDGMPCPS